MAAVVAVVVMVSVELRCGVAVVAVILVGVAVFRWLGIWSCGGWESGVGSRGGGCGGGGSGFCLA